MVGLTVIRASVVFHDIGQPACEAEADEHGEQEEEDVVEDGHGWLYGGTKETFRNPRWLG